MGGVQSPARRSALQPVPPDRHSHLHLWVASWVRRGRRGGGGGLAPVGVDPSLVLAHAVRATWGRGHRPCVPVGFQLRCGERRTWWTAEWTGYKVCAMRCRQVCGLSEAAAQRRAEPSAGRLMRRVSI